MSAEEKPKMPEKLWLSPSVADNNCEEASVYATKVFDFLVPYYSEESLALAKEEGKREAYLAELPKLRDWLEAYSIDLFTESKPPYTKPESAAAAMGRHILGLLIKEFEAAAAPVTPAPGKGGE